MLIPKHSKKSINIVKVGWLLKTKYKPVNKLIKKLDRVFSEYIRRSALTPQGYIRCFTCGAFITFRQCDCGHYVGRECMSTRFYERNVAPQCHSCNRYAEGRKDIFAINLQKKYGQGILEELNRKKNEIKQWTAGELEEKIEYYKQKVREEEWQRKQF